MTAQQSVPCTAHSSRTGQPCKRRAIIGLTVCRTHGGAAPQAKKAAADRLAELVDPAIDTLHDLLASSRDDVRLGAAKDLLDRNGLKAPEKIDMNARVSYSQLSDADLDAQIAALEDRTRTATRAAQRTTAPSASS